MARFSPVRRLLPMCAEYTVRLALSPRLLTTMCRIIRGRRSARVCSSTPPIRSSAKRRWPPDRADIIPAHQVARAITSPSPQGRGGLAAHRLWPRAAPPHMQPRAITCDAIAPKPSSASAAALGSATSPMAALGATHPDRSARSDDAPGASHRPRRLYPIRATSMNRQGYGMDAVQTATIHMVLSKREHTIVDAGQGAIYVHSPKSRTGASISPLPVSKAVRHRRNFGPRRRRPRLESGLYAGRTGAADRLLSCDELFRPHQGPNCPAQRHPP